MTDYQKCTLKPNYAPIWFQCTLHQQMHSRMSEAVFSHKPYWQPTNVERTMAGLGGVLCSKTEANRQMELDGIRADMYGRDDIDEKT